MSVSDPISDMLTRIRNAIFRKKTEVTVPYSRFKTSVLDAFVREGFIGTFSVDGDGVKKAVQINLKYSEEGDSVISSLARESKPSRKVYKGVEELQPVMGGFGSSFVSTSKGVLSDRECREQHVGGELICTLS